MKRQPEDFDSLIELLEYFNAEEKCIEYFQNRRWEGNVTCGYCGHDKVYAFSDNRRFKCAHCKKQFNVRTGTIFEESKLPLRKWVVALYLMTSHKKGISSHQLAKDIKVTQKTAWFMLHRMRHQFGRENDSEEQLEGIIEADETFVGGKNKNRHKNKKVEQCQGRAFKDKTPILGLMQRGGKVKTIVIPDTKGQTLKPLVKKIVKEGSHFISDEWMGYQGLNSIYQHDIVNHGLGQYVVGDIHTNTIEGFWPWIKRMIVGVYHYTSRKHLQNYANEATFRYNTRYLREKERFNLIFANPVGHLTYEKLIRKHG